MELYRFRSCDKLLGDKYKELEEQYFYFAPPSDQNDPMEGKIDFYWQGDKIAWFGLLKHYVWQLFILFPMIYLCDTIEELKNVSLFTTGYFLKNAPVIKSREILEKNVIRAPSFQMFVNTVSKTNKRLAVKDIQLFLTILHPVALDIVCQELSNLKIFNIDPQKTGVISTSHNQDIEEQISTYLAQENELSDGATRWDLFMLKAQFFMNEEKLDDSHQLAFQKRNFFQYEYPLWYVQKSQHELCLSDWYFACFNTAIKNPATWAYYADAHKGVGLIFDTETEFFFDFNEHKNIKFDLIKINYNNKPLSRNFFECIGKMTKAELRHWFEMDCQMSSVWETVFKNEEEWRKKYWEDQKYSLSRKGESWQHEEEYRILFPDAFGEMLPEENEDEQKKNTNQRFYYAFNILKGIVFGIRTPFEDKKKIVDILNRKCKENNRKDFPVYQAQYDKSGNCIEKVLLMTLPLDDEK